MSIKPVENSYINIGLSADVIWHYSYEIRGGELPLWQWIFFHACLQALLLQQSPSCTLTAEQLFLSRRRCKILGVGTSQRRSPGLFISTLLAKGLAPTRNLEPAGCTTASCPNILFLDIWELSSAGRCTELSKESQKVPYVHAEQNVPRGGKQTTLLSHHWAFS